MPRTEVRAKGQITIPAEVREQVHLEEGDSVVFEVTPEGNILLIPQKTIPASQAWFWSERWQQMEREADEDIAAGRVARFDGVKEFFEDLHSG